ncbi:hypothetical protein LZZ90_05315 [Flavobacterium sp. SM15]|uniref:hypothetical protein n=1 Tax=Flavobacterium sp. SM15 TaxID=2908005 RepID=UPI001EDC45C0|nr:hypothetical protein [Flavobacterium sp. SM15]MCG2610919.1 hypothetical protein [Flavobacterium sp. SM15]
MKKTILVITLLSIGSSAFASSKESKDSKEVITRSVTICETSRALDSEGNEVASAQCCKTFESQPNAETEVTTRVALKVCSDKALDMVLAAA